MTARRRQYGTGSVSFDQSRNRWIGLIEVGYTKSGGRRRIKVSGKTKAEATSKLQAKQKQIIRDGVPAAGTRRVTVKAWADNWLEMTSEKVRPGTWNANRSVVRNWVVPAIGHRSLDALTPADVRAVTKGALAAGKAPSTARRTQVVLEKMLRDAIVEGHEVPQRVLLVDGPSAGETDRDAIPLEDAVALLQAASRRINGSRWAAALLQGMRQGECLGLTWDTVDLDAGEMDVSWQLQPLPYKVPRDRTSGFRVPTGYVARQLDGALHLVRPKSPKATRIIPIVPEMVTILRRWREVAPASPHGLVWPRPDGRPQTAGADREAWRDLQDEAQVARVTDGPARPGVEYDERGGNLVGRYYVPHEARHTTATVLLEAGVSEHVVIAIMGHTSIATTRGYQHVSQALARRALDDVAGRLGMAAA